jgi:hypothetical protein
MVNRRRSSSPARQVSCPEVVVARRDRDPEVVEARGCRVDDDVGVRPARRERHRQVLAHGPLRHRQGVVEVPVRDHVEPLRARIARPEIDPPAGGSSVADAEVPGLKVDRLHELARDDAGEPLEVEDLRHLHAVHVDARVVGVPPRTMSMSRLAAGPRREFGSPHRVAGDAGGRHLTGGDRRR